MRKKIARIFAVVFAVSVLGVLVVHASCTHPEYIQAAPDRPMATVAPNPPQNPPQIGQAAAVPEDNENTSYLGAS